MYKCHDCSYSTNRSLNLRKHQNSMHKESELKEIYIDSTLNQPNHNMYYVRLKEIFKVFISGPPPPPFWKVIRMTRCFGLWHLKIRGVTFNDSLFWLREGEGLS